MARRRRVAKMRDGGRLERTGPHNDKFIELMTGEDAFGGGFHGDEDAMEAAYELNRDALLAESRAEPPPRGAPGKGYPQGPGRRPAAWWKFECPPTIRDHFQGGARHLIEEPRDPHAPPSHLPPPLRKEYLILMRQYGLLSAEERRALGV